MFSNVQLRPITWTAVFCNAMTDLGGALRVLYALHEFAGISFELIRRRSQFKVSYIRTVKRLAMGDWNADKRNVQNVLDCSDKFNNVGYAGADSSSDERVVTTVREAYLDTCRGKSFKYWTYG